MECWKEPQGDLNVTSLHDLVNKVEIITQKKNIYIATTDNVKKILPKPT